MNTNLNQENVSSVISNPQKLAISSRVRKPPMVAAIPHTVSATGRNTTKSRIGAAEIAAVARLVSRNLTESEAARRLGIRVASWFSFKSRGKNNEKFAALLEEFKAGRIDDLISKIESAADGVNMKQPDWRAAAALLKYVDINRFGDKSTFEVNTPMPVINIALMEKTLDRVFAEHTNKKSLQKSQSIPLIENENSTNI